MNTQAAPTVLIVEDEEDIAYILRFMFEREGFSVVHAADGRQAMARLEEAPPQGVVLDIMLPYHDGIEIVERLRARPGWGAVPVLMLTAKAREVDIVRALDLGADDYVTKPFQPDEVVARMRRLLRKAA
ncbi:response regulator transcription factor [Luteimonas deserti]|uniref:Response regulator n=1 Tax=Luteimonas deserti TaxID=2752306 RepID=A0A7Z0QQ23_9GAMM|nr:response regulator [Luteimonas deserti]NYZ61876.1 response regulator [Luteimonas deserti]